LREEASWREVANGKAVRRQHNATIAVIVYNLIQSTYEVIN